MRFVKRTTVNPRDPRDNRLYVGQTSDIIMGGTKSLQLPKGATGDRSVLQNNGMIRYNTTTDEVEVYQSGTWRALRFKEATQITQQTIGTGNGASTLFGPLSPTPPATVQSGTTWGGQNLFVLIENVLQISTTNYTISQNPTPTLTAAGTNNLGTTTITVTPVNGASTNFVDTIANIKVGATVTASVLGSPVFAANTTVQTIGTNTFTINNATLLSMPAGTTITLTLATGYYINFTSAATLNKAITVLHGFDK
jgi:hypothetical protein